MQRKLKLLFSCLFIGFVLSSNVATAGLISVLNATESNNDTGSGTAMAVVNGAGLGSGFPATHTGANVHGWLGLNTFPGGGTDYGWLHFDFGSVEQLDSIRVWNYNFEPLLARGVSFFDVHVSNDSAAFGDENHASWNLLASGLSLNQGPGHTTSTAYGTGFTLSSTNTRYVRLDIRDNWGNGVNTALAEVQFLTSMTAVPEPTTTVPFCFAVLLIARRRRCR